MKDVNGAYVLRLLKDSLKSFWLWITFLNSSSKNQRSQISLSLKSFYQNKNFYCSDRVFVCSFHIDFVSLYHLWSNAVRYISWVSEHVVVFLAMLIFRHDICYIKFGTDWISRSMDDADDTDRDLSSFLLESRNRSRQIRQLYKFHNKSIDKDYWLNLWIIYLENFDKRVFENSKLTTLIQIFDKFIQRLLFSFIEHFPLISSIHLLAKSIKFWSNHQ